MDINNLKSITETAKTGPLGENQLRWHVFNARSNGLEEHKAIVRIGRRVYIDIPAFERWIESQQTQSKASA